MDYKGLKKFLKKRTDDGRDWTDVDECEFIRELETELDKVAGFQDRKVGINQLGSQLPLELLLTSSPILVSGQGARPSDPYG